MVKKVKIKVIGVGGGGGNIVSELSKKLGISRQTVTSCFAFLEGAEKVKTGQTGMAKIYFWTKNSSSKT